MGFRSSLSTLFTPDSPVALVANWFLDKADRQRIDAQILACQEQITYSLRGQITTQVMLHSSSAAGAVGDCVCVAAATSTESDPLTDIRYATRADGAAIANAGVVLGVLATPAAPGAMARVIVEGIVGPSITGLAAGVPGFVKLNTATARCQRVGSLASGLYPIGFVDFFGNLTLARGLIIP